MSKSIPLPSDTTDPIVLADWLELLALTSADENSSHGDLQRVLNRLGVENADSLCIAAMNELNRRVVAAGNHYPFTFSGTLLQTRSTWQDYRPYVFCLLLAFCEDKMKKVDGIRHEVLFEHLSCIAAKNYIGGEVLRFGSPRDTLPAGFADALAKVCVDVCEWNYTRVGKTLKSKDGGLDLIAWKPFPDRHIGKVILFGHCASGSKWDSKINELQPNDFCSRWLGGDKSPIVKSFFIPHRLSEEIFNDRAISAKLFFDRCRIAYWAPDKDFCGGKIGKNATKWCRTMLKRIAA